MSGGDSADGCVPFLIIVIGIVALVSVIVGVIVATHRENSLINAESTMVTLRQEGIQSHVWTKVRLNSCANCSFLNSSYHRWLHVRLRNTSAETRTVIVCGPKVSTATTKDYGPDCFWFRLKPGTKIKKTISGNLSLQEARGFKVVNSGGIQAIDNHPVPNAPERMCYTTNTGQDSIPVVCSKDGGGNEPSPG